MGLLFSELLSSRKLNIGLDILPRAVEDLLKIAVDPDFQRLRLRVTVNPPSYMSLLVLSLENPFHICFIRSAAWLAKAPTRV